jgi:hypothetical protein
MSDANQSMKDRLHAERDAEREDAESRERFRQYTVESNDARLQKSIALKVLVGSMVTAGVLWFWLGATTGIGVGILGALASIAMVLDASLTIISVNQSIIIEKLNYMIKVSPSPA